MGVLNLGRQAKLEKSMATYDIRVAGLHLSPGRINGHVMCPDMTPGCRRGCLDTCGRGQMNVVQAARRRKSAEFLADPVQFGRILNDECISFIMSQSRKGVEAWIRPNLTSDIAWESYLTSGVLKHCYDYTKSLQRWRAQPYHLTYSWNERSALSPIALAREALKAGRPGVAVVVDTAIHEALLQSSSWHGVPIVDGTKDDQRPYDPPGSLVLLKPLGKMRHDTTGFVVRKMSTMCDVRRLEVIQ